MGMYSDWGKSQSKFLRLKPGESEKVTWNGNSTKARNTFGAEGFEFEFETPYGVKLFSSSNPTFVEQFDNFHAGQVLWIRRKAEGEKGASYTVATDGPQ